MNYKNAKTLYGSIKAPEDFYEKLKDEAAAKRAQLIKKASSLAAMLILLFAAMLFSFSIAGNIPSLSLMPQGREAEASAIRLSVDMPCKIEISGGEILTENENGEYVSEGSAAVLSKPCAVILKTDDFSQNEVILKVRGNFFKTEYSVSRDTETGINKLELK